MELWVAEITLLKVSEKHFLYLSSHGGRRKIQAHPKGSLTPYFQNFILFFSPLEFRLPGNEQTW